jgi:hypothetical protein
MSSIENPEEQTIQSMDLPNDSSEWPEGFMTYDLKLMANVVTKLELWEWFRMESPPENEGYQWWGHENINKISEGLGKDNNHSGASFAFAMRTMQYIAKEGFSQWKKNNIKNAK